MFHVEEMTSADFEFAVNLANTMSWGMTVEDFMYSVSLEPNGCFVAFGSSATNLVSEDLNGVKDVFVYDCGR